MQAKVEDAEGLFSIKNQTDFVVHQSVAEDTVGQLLVLKPVVRPQLDRQSNTNCS